jgi:xanthine dehydrogenase YagS FAD-binding subunit
VRTFNHINARTIEEAIAALQRYQDKARILAGGTDLLGIMKDELLPQYPEALINIKTISGLEYIREEDGWLRIGALASLDDIAETRCVKDQYPALAQAASRAASPHLRAMGTLGGNLCQDIRCWYYRNPNNRFPCLRKGGGRCYAIEGDNRYHSIMGGSVEGGCYAVHPSDLAPALIALNAEAVTSKRMIKLENFFQVDVVKTTVLDFDEIVTEIRIPAPADGSRSGFIKFAIRKAIDFPIVNCAASILARAGRIENARIWLNAIHVKPFQAARAEEVLIGKEINEETAEAAGAAAMMDAKPFDRNRYMVQIAKTLIKRSILACKSES